jgi:O-acetyl-ADP-ribose deacetylase
MPFTIVRNDITKMTVDAIVNAANTNLKMGGGVCGAIFKAAGASELQRACDQIAPIQTGEAIITPGYALTAKHIIHTAGPVYLDGQHHEEALLRSCYLNSLKLALENNCESIAFPLISSGIYGYPSEEALQVANKAIQDFLHEHDIQVYLVVFDQQSFAISEKLLGEVESYIDEHYVNEHWDGNRLYNNRDVDELNVKYVYLKKSLSIEPSKVRLADKVGNLDESFSTTLLRLIDAKGKTDVEVYKRANIDRKLFSKIRSDKGYMPSKKTAVALAIALELNLHETDDLLERAGYALSSSQKFDVIVEYFIVQGKFDIYEINEVLFKYDQSLLGG